MKLQEEHSGLLYKTKGGVSPQGKPKVYFCAHPVDFKLYFEEISEEILTSQTNCAIFYCENGDNSDFSQARQEVLEEMQLFVMPVSAELLMTRNTALEQEFRLAQEKKIPVLPLMQGEGLEQLFNEKCGDLQFLDKHRQDATALPYEDKLKKYLESVLVGDELAEKIRAAFDAYIFLSYRKKDRKYARSLMKLIHENEFCRDIAIWYDEFLVPGEDFNNAIREALEKCKLFALLVTPNLIKEPNYVQKHEYPAARQAGKPVVPVQFEKTSRLGLERKYSHLPTCIDAADRGSLSRELTQHLSHLARQKGSPQHNFFIGLAYLNGIDVESDRERALTLIQSAAEGGLPEAYEKLVSMYKNGEGVERSYAASADWQARLAAFRKAEWERQPNEDSGLNYIIVLCNLGDDLMAMGQVDRAAASFGELLTVCKLITEKLPDNRKLLRSLSLSYGRLGNIAQARSRVDEAERCCRQSMKLRE